MSLISFLLLLVAGSCLALFASRFSCRARRRPGISSSCGRNFAAIQQRLAEGNACLERLARERDSRNEPGLGRTAEDRIVWRELIELELQDLDAEVDRIREAAGLPGSGRPKGSTGVDRRSP